MAVDRLAQAVAKYGKSGVARLLNAQGFHTSKGGAISERYIRDALRLRPGKTSAAQASARGGLNAMLRQVDFRHYPKAPKTGGAITAKPRGRFEPREQIVRGMKNRPPSTLFRVGEYDVRDHRGVTIRKIERELTKKALLTLYVDNTLPATLWRFTWFGEFHPGSGSLPGMIGGPSILIGSGGGVDADDDYDPDAEELPMPHAGANRPALGWKRDFRGSTRQPQYLPEVIDRVNREIENDIQQELARQQVEGGPVWGKGGPVQSVRSVSAIYHNGRLDRKTGNYIPSWASRFVTEMTGYMWRRVTYADVSLAKGG